MANSLLALFGFGNSMLRQDSLAHADVNDLPQRLKVPNGRNESGRGCTSFHETMENGTENGVYPVSGVATATGRAKVGLSGLPHYE
jgi:hypothetical protein